MKQTNVKKDQNISSMTDLSNAIKGYAAATRGGPDSTLPYADCVKKNFPLRAMVRFVNLPDDCELLGKTGITLGTSFVNVTDHYIVLLDEPTDTHLAITITEACLEPA